MIVLAYDKTFEGFLSLVFYVYERKLFPDKITFLGNTEKCLWAEEYEVQTEVVKAQRVWNALLKRLSENMCKRLLRVHLVESDDVALVLLHFIQKVFSSNQNIELDFSDSHVLEIYKLDKTVSKEAERLAQFVRFQKTADQIYYSSLEPECNVLPLMINHFQERFADQQWVIYDNKRKYGFYYNCKETVQIQLQSDKINPLNGKINEDVLEEGELLFQSLWKQYFKAICIEERRNEKLQMQHMPKRFWKYLTEKQD